MNIVVLGAGYGGLYAANRLAKKLPKTTSITVVNPRDVFVERVRLHQLAVGNHAATRTLAEMLNKRVMFVQDRANRIDSASVYLDSGKRLDYDHLIYAVGSTPAMPIEGSEHAYSVGDLDHAQRLRARLDRLPEHAVVRVIGGGLTGLEAVTEIAEARPDLDVHLHCNDALAADYPDASRAHIARTMTKLEITVHEYAPVVRITETMVGLTDNSMLASDCTVLTTGFGVPQLAQHSGLATDDLGRLRTDEFLRAVSNPRIIGVGDAAIGPEELTGHIRMACGTAVPSGLYAADSLRRELRGKRLKPFSLGYAGQCVSLGRSAAIVQFTHADDRARNSALKGRLAIWTKEAIVRGATYATRTAPSFRTIRGPERTAERTHEADVREMIRS